MPKLAKEMGALEVSRLSEPGLHAVGGVAGLCLQITPTGARSWIFRIKVGAKRRSIGFGPYPARSLADARRAATEARDKIVAGDDPIQKRKDAKSALMAAQAMNVTFRKVAGDFLDSKSAEKTQRHTKVWASSLETFVYPVIGDMLVRDVELAHVVKVLAPIWTTKTDTATKLRGRIEAILAMATVRGYRSGPNPAQWKGNLDHVLPQPGKVAKVTNQPALPYSRIGAFMTKLHEVSGMGAKALEFAILTAARSGEVRGATWNEIDMDAALWTIPGERMKAGKEHRVPLTRAAIALLEALPKNGPFVFPAIKGGMLSDMTISAVTRRMDEAQAKADGQGWKDAKSGLPVVPHGFRSTFRDWAAEMTAYPNEVVEMALAHTIGNAVEAAYRRGDLFEKRRNLMEEWANYCSMLSAKAGEVVPIRKNRA